MQRRSAILGLAILSACSSSTPTQSGSPTPGAPASIVLVTGDGQSAPPSTALPVTLSAQVKDAAGLAVPSVSVHFAIDSGGGSLSTSALTTDTDGTVSGVIWTLGAASGTNVVSVTVGTLPPMRFHAQAFGSAARTLLSNAPTGSAGGTLTYIHAGDPLNGMTVTVPPGAYASGANWTIVADSSVTPRLPAGFVQVGPTLVIGNTQGFADSNMTLTMPMHLASDMAVAPFYFDPASGTLEGIPLVARTDTSATLATRHFSADLMAIPGQGAVGSLRASLRAAFGTVRVVWVAIPQAQLAGTYTTSFLPGVDDWEFINYGDFVSPHGDCEGMSITAMYYHYFFRLGNSPGPALYHHYDQSVANQWDNVQGIRYAGSVQGDYAALWSATVNQLSQFRQIASRSGSTLTNLTASWIILTLKLTSHPVLIALEADSAAHAVVAYQATSVSGVTTVWVADPNAPGVRDRVLTYNDGVLDPVNFQSSATSAAGLYTDSYALGVSAEVSMNQLASRWTEFTAGTAGADRYATHYRVDIQNQLDSSWSPLTASEVVYNFQVSLRTICTDCTDNPADSVQQLTLWNAAGSGPAAGSTYIAFPGPAVSFNAVEYAARAADTTAGFLDVMPFSVVYQPVSVTSPTSWLVNTPLTFTVVNPPAVPGAHYQFEWDFNDGTALADIDDNPEATHTYTSFGARHVVVSITDLHTGHVIARAQSPGDVAPPHWVWTFDASSETVVTPPILATKSDTTELNAFNPFFADLQANPSHWVFFASDSAQCQGVVLEQFPDALVFTSARVPASERTVVAASSGCLHSGDPDISTATFGTIGSGTITGNLIPLNEVSAVGVLGGSINAQMTGATLAGTFTWIISYSTGYALYSFTFSAHQVAGP